MFSLVTSSIAIPGTKNPLSDIPSIAGFVTPTGQGAGTAQGASGSDSVISQQQQTASCGVGGLIGAGVGAIGFLAGPVGIGSTILGGVAGCYIASTFFPQSGAALANAIQNSVPGIGIFLQGIIVLLTYVGPIISFVSDATNFEIALLTSAPEIGAFLLPFQAMTIIWLFMYGAEYIRGVGTLG